MPVKARDSLGAQAYSTVRRPIRRERIGSHCMRNRTGATPDLPVYPCPQP